jgi:hypothetical protein
VLTRAARPARRLQYKVMRAGGGPDHPTADSPCECHYEGRTADAFAEDPTSSSNTFDGSYARGSPTTFAPNQVIKGWTEGARQPAACAGHFAPRRKQSPSRRARAACSAPACEPTQRRNEPPRQRCGAARARQPTPRADTRPRPTVPRAFPRTSAMQLMVEGDKWELYIPSEMAYGERGSPPKINGGDVLVFTIEIIKIKGGKKPASRCDVKTLDGCKDKEKGYVSKKRGAAPILAAAPNTHTRCGESHCAGATARSRRAELAALQPTALETELIACSKRYSGLSQTSAQNKTQG